MIYIYRNEPLFDTLMCVVGAQVQTEDYTTEQKDDVIIIKQHGEIVGYNIQNAASKFEIPFDGVLLTEDATFEQAVKEYLTAHVAEYVSGDLAQGFVVGHVETCVPHSDSNKLSVCQINLGTETVQIVCGASNIAAGQKVVVAKVGCMMPSGLLIAPSVLRGEPSNGMVCSSKELGLSEEYSQPGIMVLPEDAPVGKAFFNYLTEEFV